MELTTKNKATIDAMSYKQLLAHWRFALVGNPWFEGETGDYWSARMTKLRSKPGGNDTHIAASKDIGWEK